MVSPWHRVRRPEFDGWGRSHGAELVAFVTDAEARYREPGGAWRRRGCDDFEASCRTANAGLRLLGVDVDDVVLRLNAAWSSELTWCPRCGRYNRIGERCPRCGSAPGRAW